MSLCLYWTAPSGSKPSIAPPSIANKRPRAAVIDVVRGRIRGRRLGQGELRSDTGEITEVIIEGVILFHNYNDMLNWVGGLGYRRACHARSN